MLEVQCWIPPCGTSVRCFPLSVFSIVAPGRRNVYFARMSWNVLHVRPRCEKKMAEFCRIQRYQYYLPLRKETKVYQRRKVTVEKPVFPGYVFVSYDRDQRVELLKTNNIVRILESLDEKRLLHELEQIQKALAVDSTLGAVSALQKGRLIRITGGPFMGVEGQISDLKGPAKVLLNVDMIGRAVAVEVDRDFVELIE